MVRRFTRCNFLNLAAMAAAAPLFEVKALRGVDFVLRNYPTARKFLIETMPGGIALFDYNNDGLLDIFLVNGGRITESLHVSDTLPRTETRESAETGNARDAEQARRDMQEFQKLQNTFAPPQLRVVSMNGSQDRYWTLKIAA